MSSSSLGSASLASPDETSAARAPSVWPKSATPAHVLRDQALVALLAACARGNEGAFVELYERTRPFMQRVAQRIMRDRDAVSDALQESYLKIWQHAGSYDPARASPLTWMSALVRHRCIDMLRRPEATVPHDSLSDVIEPVDKAVTIDEQVARKLDCAWAVRSLARLAPHESKCLRLAYLHEHPHEEIAAMLSAPLGTVKSWIRRSVIKLQHQHVS